MKKSITFFEKYRGALYKLMLVVVCFVMISIMSFELWEPYQVPKDRWYCLGIIWAFVLVFVLRKLSYKDIEVWIAIASGLAFKYIYFYKNNINKDYYGEIYSKLISYKWTIWILFFALLLNSIRRRQIISVFCDKRILLILYTVVVAVTVIVFRYAYIPLICPMYAFIFTKLSKKEWENVVFSFAIGMYSAFVFHITKCFLFYRDIYEAGRYMGGFCSVENIGLFCGCAVVSCLYFFILIMQKDNKKWYWALGPIILAIVPCLVISKTDSRSAVVAIALAFLAAFVFARKTPNIKDTVIRLVVAFTICIASILILFALSKFLNKHDSWELGYALEHIKALGDDEYRSGYFGEDSILNSINRFSADRLIGYAESIRQIEWKGHEFRVEPPYYFTTPHNFFLIRIIEMGIIPGAILCLWIAFFTIKSCGLCAKGFKGAVFPLLWMVYSIVVLFFTITKWNSLLPFGMFILSNAMFFDSSNSEREIETC